VLSAVPGADTESCLDLVDAVLEIGCGEDEVVNLPHRL
jgi:hypothetical protein